MGYRCNNIHIIRDIFEIEPTWDWFCIHFARNELLQDVMGYTLALGRSHWLTERTLVVLIF